MKRFWFAARLLIFAFAGTAFAASFQNGSFEIGASDICGANENLQAGSGVIPGWTVSVGNVDWTAPYPCNWVSSDGTHSLDLIGGATSIGGVQQTFDTIPGATYQVSFDLAGNPSSGFPPAIKPLTVTVAGTTHNYGFDIGGHSGTSMGWATQTFTFVANGTTATINFVSDVGVSSFAGAALDNVRVTLIAAPPFQNGSFEIGAPSTCGAGDNLLAGSNAIPGWTVSVGSIDWAGPCNWTSQDGSHSLDLIGGGASAVSIGGVQQTFGTVPGTTYQVSFYLAANPSTLFAPVIKPLTVTVAGTTHNYSFDRTGHDGLNMGWVQQTFTFVAIGSITTINFVSDISPVTSFAGAALDNVSITPVAAPATTATTLTSGYNPAPVGSSNAILTATVTGGNNPTGAVTFTVNGVDILCSAVPLTPTGTATCSASGLAVGNYLVGAVYSGDAANLGSTSNTLTQVIYTPVITPTGWTGALGNVVFGDGSHIPPVDCASWSTLGSGTYPPTVVSDGTAGPATLSYNASPSIDPTGMCGKWGFSTVATAAGDVALNWSYGGFHSFFHVTAELSAFIIRGSAADSTYSLVSAGPQDCDPCTPPSGGFAYSGQITIPNVSPGDTYGFVMTGSHYDGTDVLSGTLTLTGTSPTSTALGSSLQPATVGSSVTFTATVSGSNPAGFVTFMDGPSVIAGCSAVALTGVGNVRTAACPTSSLAVGNHGISVKYSGDMANASSANMLSQDINPVANPLATPSLIRVVATGGTGAFLIGRVDGAAGLPITLQVSKASSCVNGVLSGGVTVLSPVTPTPVPDIAGYFGAPVSGVSPGEFVTVQVTSPSSTAASPCIASSGDNDFWPRALDFGALSSVGDYIDAPGKARWYKFSVTPGQKIQVTLSGLPADYDLAVFKDIGQAFLSQLVPTSTADLTKLSAEFAPSVFSPSVFSPSVFSPSVFSPDAYSPSVFSPSVFSPSVFSPSVFSPSVFSPSVFSPSVFSPSVFSPSVFSPSVFSPSVFSPSVFSPSVFSPTEIAQAFSSAQTRSILGVSATPGTGNEFVAVNTWSNTGDFYVRVSGRGGASSTNGQFTLSVAKSATTCTGVTNSLPGLLPRPAVTGSGRQTIILTDSSRVTGDPATLLGKLASLAGSVAGVVVDLKDDARAVKFRAQADANASCPYAKNLLALEVKSIVDGYRASNSGMRYVVIAGNDGAVPYFRYPDESLLGQESGYVPPVASVSASDASLRQDYVLGQDAYGSSTSISMRSIDFPIPGLAVGRLVETATEIGGMIDAYLANGVVNPASTLVTGYDFLADVADAVSTELQAGTHVAPQTLITANGVSPQDPTAWTAAQLGQALLGSRHDVMFLGGHFSANSALAADFSTNLLTTDLATATVNLTNSIVFSAGCHSGYNIVDGDAINGVTLKLDWAQAFAQKKATLIAGTGYQYGDTEFIEYSERLYLSFARQLRAGVAGTPVFVGEALVRAKLDYLAATPDILGIHQKALLEATVFGLPMLGVNMPYGRSPNPGTAGVITPVAVAPGPSFDLGLKIASLSLSPTPVANSLCLKNPPYDAGITGAQPLPCPSGYTTAQWLTGPDGVKSNPAEPVLPLQIVNVTPTTNVVLRGVGFVGGSYTESTVVPLTGAPTTELRGVHTPFLSPVFFPMRLWTPNYYGSLSGAGGTKLIVTPAQHRAADVTQGTSTLRQFTGLNLRLYYSANITATALSAAPTIVGVSAMPSGGGVTFTAQVLGDPAAAIHEVWVTYTSGSGPSGTWTSLPLTQCSATPPAVCGTTTDSQKWMGQLPSPPADLKYIVQAVNGVGMVSADDNLGAYYSVGGTAPVATTLALVGPPTSATYGGSAAVTARLSAGAAPVAGKLVTISLGGASQAGVTDANGNATVNVPVASVPGTYPLTASFSGDQSYLPSSASSAGFTIGKAPSNLVALSPLGATLTGTIGGNAQPIDGSVAFSLTGSRGPITTYANTDYLGRAILPPPGLAAGTYNVVQALFAGNATYNGFTLTFTSPQSINIPKADQAIAFGPLSGKTFGDADFTVTATATSSLPVSFGATGPCAVTASTVHITGAGTCTITASQAGDLDFNAATPVAQSFTVARTVLIVSATASPNSFTYGDDVLPVPMITPVYGATYSGTLACLLNPTPVVTLTGKPTATPANAGTYTIVPTFGAGQVSPACDLVANPATLTVNKAPSAFAGIAASLTVPARTSASITGQLNRPDKTAIYPKAADLGGGAFAVALRNAGGTVKSYSPTPGNPNGAFTITDGTLAPDTYTLEFNYAGGPDFLAATTFTSALRVVGFASTGNMAQARASHTATLLNDGRVLVAGGSSIVDDDRRASRTAEIYCPDPYTPPATPVRTLAQWCPNGVGKFSAAGRGNASQVGVGNLVQARSYHTATLLPNGTVLLAGGYDSSGIMTATAEIYDPTDPVVDKFTAVASLPGNAAAGHTATLFTKSGKSVVLVVGGGSASSQLYDVATKTWSRSGSMTGARSTHTATLVGTKILVAGGSDLLSRTLQTTTLYDTVTGTFASGPTMLAPRELHTASTIANGKVLLAGGRVSSGNNYGVALSPLAEIYDPNNATTPFVAAGFASGTGRFGHSASALIANGQPDGRVVVAGGGVSIVCGQQLATSEVYASGAFAIGAPMSAARVRHTATVLKDGRVLVVGGRGTTGTNICGPLKTTEIWNAP